MKSLLYGILFSILSVSASAISSVELPLPQLPAGMTSPQERATFIAMHFWDAMDFNDESKACSQGFIEQNFVNFASVLPVIGDTIRIREAVDTLMKRASANRCAYDLLLKTAETYLNETDSPMRDEELYIPFLQAVLRDRAVDEASLTRYGYQLDMAMKNRPGSVATDFDIVTRNGDTTTLGTLAVDAPLHVVFFYDVECEHCGEVIARLSRDPIFTEAISNKKIAVTAVYVQGDAGAYSSTPSIIPDGWNDTMNPDNSIENRELYYLPGIPTIYLLDNDRHVIAKDISPDRLIETLRP